MLAMFTLLAVAAAYGPKTHPQSAASAVRITIGPDTCDPVSNIPANGELIYATNTDKNRRISANFEYNASPPNYGGTLYRTDFSIIHETFPFFHEERLAPGERRMIGCSQTPRPKTDGSTIKITLAVSVAGAVFVDPSQPDPPAEDPKNFAALWLQPRASCPSTSGSNGTIILVDLNPSKTLSGTLRMASGPFPFNTGPFGTVELPCRYGPPTGGVVGFQGLSLTPQQRIRLHQRVN